MFLKTIEIDDYIPVTEIVMQDYRTAEVFRKYGINYCCGGRMPLLEACHLRGIDIEKIRNELNDAVRNVYVPNSLDFGNWDIDFLIDFICNVHHEYLYRNLPDTTEDLTNFVQGHKSKYPYLSELLNCVLELQNEMLPHMEHEEEVIFPYIRQIAHAHKTRESYAALLVRTLRKPVEDLMKHVHDRTARYLFRVRELTNEYNPPPGACINHKTIFFRLRGLDNDLVQHMHLENNILFPKALAMEREMLDSK
jgi:regulator of cell morphogenesis and NO signaling